MSEVVKIKLPDGSIKESPREASIEAFVREQIGAGLAKAALGAAVDGRAVDLSRRFEELNGGPEPLALRIITPRDEEALDWLRHSSAHILAAAVKRVFPEAHFDDGPPTETGFYYDISYERPFTPEDLERIEAEAEKIIQEGVPFERRVVSKAEALAWAEETGERHKLRILNRLPDDAEITLYRNGGFEDLCRGPHIPSTKRVGGFKILSASGAYEGGDETREQLQRIHGTAFFDQKQLKEFLDRLEEAKRRDHRKLGRELDLFSISPEVGGGLVLWHPRGALVRKIVEDFWRDEHLKAGYDLVYSPHVGRSTLWETSGHLGFYKESMFPEMEMEGQSFFAKPMNCPFHLTIYQSHLRSYRDLPIKLAELGTVYRFERSGTLHGLMRVRGFTQDDAHIFVAPENLEEQVVDVVNFCLSMLRTFGFTEFEAYVASRPEKSVGDPEKWERATEALKLAADKAGLTYKMDEGGGAFYGPKIDLKLRDAIGRTWQCSTIQFDFNMSERFDLRYVGEDNTPHRPYMIHRALLGSLERFMGVLIEHYAGAFPLWLAPVQIGVVTVADRHLDHARKVAAALRERGLRVEVDESSEKMGAKIRKFSIQKLPVMLVIGDKEVEQGGAALRRRGGQDEGFVPLTDLVDRLAAEAARPALGQSPGDA